MSDENAVQDVPEQKPVVTDRAAFLKLENDSKEIVKRYGEDSYFAFMAKIGSDGIYAQKVVADLINQQAGGEPGIGIGLSPDSPQENNVTGRLDHTGDVATKVKTPTQTAVQPPVKYNDGGERLDVNGLPDGNPEATGGAA